MKKLVFTFVAALLSIGAFAQQGDAPGTMISSESGDISFSAAAGTITMSQLISIRDTEIPALWAAIGGD